MLEHIILPLRGLVNFFSPPAPSLLKVAPLQTQSQPQAQTRCVDTDLLGRLPPAKPPQVLRSRRAQDGRIVIAGRLQDVCAELDRLCQEPA